MKDAKYEIIFPSHHRIYGLFIYPTYVEVMTHFLDWILTYLRIHIWFWDFYCLDTYTIFVRVISVVYLMNILSFHHRSSQDQVTLSSPRWPTREYDTKIINSWQKLSACIQCYNNMVISILQDLVPWKINYVHD